MDFSLLLFPEKFHLASKAKPLMFQTPIYSARKMRSTVPQKYLLTEGFVPIGFHPWNLEVLEYLNLKLAVQLVVLFPLIVERDDDHPLKTWKTLDTLG